MLPVGCRTGDAVFALTFLTRPLPGVTLEQFVEHYRGVHFVLGQRLPGLLSYQQSMLVKEDGAWPLSDLLNSWEALSIYTFESVGDAEAAFSSEEGIALDADTGLFMEWESVLSLPGEVLQRWEPPSAELA